MSADAGLLRYPPATRSLGASFPRTRHAAVEPCWMMSQPSRVNSLTQAVSHARSVDAVGLGICELVDRNGRVASANCIDWTQLPVVEHLSSIAPTVIEADVRAAALAEGLF